VLVEDENNDSWLWFLTLVRKQVLGLQVDQFA
jgi:hypothetical protein